MSARVKCEPENGGQALDMTEKQQCAVRAKPAYSYSIEVNLGGRSDEQSTE